MPYQKHQERGISHFIHKATLYFTTTITFSTFELTLRRLGAIFIIHEDGVVVIHTSVLDFIGDKEQCGEKMYESPEEFEWDMTSGCFEIMAQGTRNAKRQMD